MTPLSLDIVLVNWNAGDQLRECVASIPAAARDVALRRVVVVDNASSDDSLRGVEETGVVTSLIRNAENRGFAAACNQGVAGAAADCVLLLNPDTRLFADSLRVPLAHLAAPDQADVGVCGIQMVDEAGQVMRSCSRFPDRRNLLHVSLGLDHLWPERFPGQPMVEWDHDSTRDVDQVIGAFFLVRRELYERLRGLDERFFVYFEEVDFCLRARRAGFRTVYLATARAFHRGAGTSQQIRARRLFYALRSRLLFAAKHFSPPDLALTTAATLGVEPITRTAGALLRGSPAAALETLQAYGMTLRDLPRLAAGRREEG